MDIPPSPIRIVTSEDSFLFKLIAGRDDDIEDMNMLVQAGLDDDIVRGELDVQIDRLGDDQVATVANEALVELEDRYGVITPIADRIWELATRYYRGLDVPHALDEPMTVDELAVNLDLNAAAVRDRGVFDWVSRAGETVHPAAQHTDN